jgi:fructose-1,6-bisphosphatase I
LIAEEAGGSASDGQRRILDLVPTELHQKTPLFLGSCQDVRECEQFIQEKHEAVSSERRANARG